MSLTIVTRKGLPATVLYKHFRPVTSTALGQRSFSFSGRCYWSRHDRIVGLRAASRELTALLEEDIGNKLAKWQNLHPEREDLRAHMELELKYLGLFSDQFALTDDAATKFVEAHEMRRDQHRALMSKVEEAEHAFIKVHANIHLCRLVREEVLTSALRWPIASGLNLSMFESVGTYLADVCVLGVLNWITGVGHEKVKKLRRTEVGG